MKLFYWWVNMFAWLSYPGIVIGGGMMTNWSWPVTLLLAFGIPVYGVLQKTIGYMDRDREGK